MQIGELARRSGVSIDTIRFYERRGVLPAPARRPSGYRTYTPATVERIILARTLQGLGFTLDEVASALRAHDSGRASCESERWRIAAALARIDQRLAELTALRTRVADTLAACEAGQCRILGPG